MSSDKPPSLPIPTPSASSSPRTGGTSILNGSATNAGGQGVAQNATKVKTDLHQPATSNSMQPNSHVLPHPNMSSQPHSQYSSSPHNSAPPGQYGYGNDYGNQGYTVGVGLEFSNQHHLSQAQQQSPQTATSGSSLGHYQGHPSHMQPYSAPPPHQPYPFNFPSTNGVSSPGGMPGQIGILPLPANSGLTPAPSPLTSVPPSASHTSPQSGGPGGSYNGGHTFDTTGQIAPPGMKPRVTATLWEDEGSLCFQVEAKGVCVARREDNHMINGTKLLNVAGMTRGRRDGILKSEKVRHVVKIGPMHLKGVWIPFDRALDFANKEKITEMLYPLFVHNIGALLYHPTNTSRTNAVMAAANKRFEGVGQPPLQVRRNPSDILPSSHHGVSPLAHLASHSIAPHPQMRPDMARAITFPTPPSSASSMNMNGSDNYWSQSGMMTNSGSQSLPIDTVINPSRSMPTTPATTPPGNALAQLQQYPPASYTEARGSPLYASQPQSMSQQNMNRFGPALPQPPHYLSQTRDGPMGPPPSARGANASRPSSSQNNADGQVKDESGIEEQAGLEEEGQEAQEEEADHDPEHEYDSNIQYSNANGRGYFQPGDTPQLSPDMTGSPNHQGPGTPNRSVYSTPNVNVSRGMEGGGASTPRTATTPQQQWIPQQSGYSTPPRAAPNPTGVRNPSSGRMYNMLDGSDRAVDTTNGSSNEGYSQHGMGVPVTPQQSQSFGGLNGSNKRIREMDDQETHGSRPSSRGDEERGAADGTGLKRRKTIRGDGPPQTAAAGNMTNPAFNRDTNSRPMITPQQPRRAGGR